MATYNKKTVKKIVLLIEEGNHSISTICKIVGIGRKTFYDWRNTRPDFLEAITEAEQRRSDGIYELANQAVKRKLEGYYQTVSRTVYVPSEDDAEVLEIKQHVVTKRFCEPDIRLLMEILGSGNGRKKKKGMNVKNVNPALVVKRAEEQVKKNLSEVPPFTLKAKEVVEQTMPAVKGESTIIDEEIVGKSEEILSETKEKTEIALMELKESGKEDKKTMDNKKEEEPYISSRSYPLPPGYTRRG